VLLEGELNDKAGEEVVMEDMDYAKLKNKVVKPKKRVVGKAGPELSSLRSSSLCNFLQLAVTSSLLGPNILISTLFSNVLSLCSSLWET
jgi:hypothetical protein